MQGDDLTIFLFLIGTAVSVGLAAMSQAGWKHRTLISTMFGSAALLALAGIGWPWLKDISPGVTAVVSQVATNPVAWFVVILSSAMASVLRPAKVRPGEPPRQASPRQSVAPQPSRSPSAAPRPAAPPATITAPIVHPATLDKSPPPLDPNILYNNEEGKVITLKFLPDTLDKNEDALLLIIYGYNILRQKAEVSVSSARSALRLSGCREKPPQASMMTLGIMGYLAPTSAPDPDDVARDYISRGYIFKGGLARGGFFALTEDGINHARSLMTDLIARA
jgi:hypothetical protein